MAWEERTLPGQVSRRAILGATALLLMALGAGVAGGAVFTRLTVYRVAATDLHATSNLDTDAIISVLVGLEGVARRSTSIERQSVPALKVSRMLNRMENEGAFKCSAALTPLGTANLGLRECSADVLCADRHFNKCCSQYSFANVATVAGDSSAGQGGVCCSAC